MKSFRQALRFGLRILLDVFRIHPHRLRLIWKGYIKIHRFYLYTRNRYGSTQNRHISSVDLISIHFKPQWTVLCLKQILLSSFTPMGVS